LRKVVRLVRGEGERNDIGDKDGDRDRDVQGRGSRQGKGGIRKEN
jgi:hypothetical protein